MGESSSPVESTALQYPPSGFERQLLQISSKLRIQQSASGELSVQGKSKLRYSYELQDADGNQFTLDIKANVRYALQTDGDSTRLKAAVKLEVGVLQRDVTAEFNPLLEAETADDSQSTEISDLMGGFQADTDALTDQFLIADTPDGDSLIEGVVDGFNRLITSIQSLFAGAPSSTESGNAESTVQAPEVTSEVSLPEPADSSPVETADVALEPIVPNEEAAAPTSDQTEAGEPTEETPEVADAIQRFVLINAQLRFRESFTRLVGAFDSPEGDEQQAVSQQSTLSYSARLQASIRAYQLIDQSPVVM